MFEENNETQENVTSADETFENEISDNEMTENSELKQQDEESKAKKLPYWSGILLGAACMAVIAAAVIICVFVLGKSSRTSETSAAVEQKVNYLLTLFNTYYIGEVPDEAEISDAIEEGAADAVTELLDDKYAVYYTPEEYAELKESVSGKYAGIGVSISQDVDGGEIVVIKVFEGSPAEKAGLQAGDVLVGTGVQSSYEDIDDLVADVRGEIGTTVDIIVRRDGEEFTLTMERAEVEMDTVSWEMMENNIGYVYVEEFDTVTVTQFDEALNDLISQGAESFIIDLRWNLGGDYDAVVAMCDRVLPEGTIMTVRDKNGNEKVETSDEENQLDYPMVILVNEYTASASEVFTGAVMDNGLATVVGTTTYGKGVVQSIFTLYDGSGIKFTTQEYLTPNGTALNGVGITPNVYVEIPDEAYDDGELDEDEDLQLQKAIEILSK